MFTATPILLFCTVAAGSSSSRSAAEIKAEVEALRAEYAWPSGEEAAGGIDESQFCTVNQLAYELNQNISSL